MKRFTGTCVSLVLAAACGGSGGGSGSTGQPALREAVTGTRFVRYHQDDGTVVTRPSPDIDQAEISALIPEGSGTREALGSFAPDGTFSIPDVGTGPYLLRHVPAGGSPRYFVESSRSVDLGTEVVGRPGRVLAQLSSTILFNLSGLEAWSNGDSVSLFSTGARFNLLLNGAVAPAAGATAALFSNDFQYDPLPVAGDLGWLLQRKQRTAPVTYTAVTRAATLLSLVDMADGDTATLDVPLTAPPETGSVAIDLRRSQFATAFAGAGPAGVVTYSGTTAQVRAYPRTLTATNYATLLSLVPAPGTTDLDAGALGYARPFPPWFLEVLALDHTFGVRIPAALGASGVTFTGVYPSTRPLPAPPGPIVPTLGPAQSPRVGGRDALVAQAGVGLTPTISWAPPALGAPTYYWVTLYESVSGTLVARASVVTPQTSIAVPPRVMVPGSAYFANIVATYEPNFDFAAPTRSTAPRDQVPMFTALFTP